MRSNTGSGNSATVLRYSIEQRLSNPRYADVWNSISLAFADDADEERDYWDFALSLRDRWLAMSRAPTKIVQKTVTEIAQLAANLANKLAAHKAEIETLKGYLDIDKHTFMEADLRLFSVELLEPSDPTEAMRSRPRGMAHPSAERTYVARALTWYLLSSGLQPMARVVADTAGALLDLGPNEVFDEKHVRDITEDICRGFKSPPASVRRQSKIL